MYLHVLFVARGNVKNVASNRNVVQGKIYPASDQLHADAGFNGVFAGHGCHRQIYGAKLACFGNHLGALHGAFCDYSAGVRPATIKSAENIQYQSTAGTLCCLVLHDNIVLSSLGIY